MIDYKNILSGDRRSIAKLITLVENNSENARKPMEHIYSHTGKAIRIGVTGPPGSGKSTLVDAITAAFREKNLTVGIIAIDPTSPFTGGALLGDRIRMQRVGLDPGVFIRSMATRGSLGGICASAGDVADILDASGKDVIITETVGVGQSEVAIVRVADSTLVVLCPEAGDAVQTMKAGLMEIADIFVVNKSDRDGAAKLTVDVRSTLELKKFDENEWRPQVIETSATQNTGITELIETLEKHRKYLENEDRLIDKRIMSATRKIQDLAISHIERHAWSGDNLKKLEKLAKEIVERKLTPHEAVKQILSNLKY